MKYQIVEISEYLININEYNTQEEALTCFRTWIEDAKKISSIKNQKNIHNKRIHNNNRMGK